MYVQIPLLDGVNKDILAMDLNVFLKKICKAISNQAKGKPIKVLWKAQRLTSEDGNQ